MACVAEKMPSRGSRDAGSGGRVRCCCCRPCGLVAAAEGGLDEVVAILEQIMADLTASAGKGVEGVEIDLVCYIDNDAIGVVYLVRFA